MRAYYVNKLSEKIVTEAERNNMIYGHVNKLWIPANFELIGWFKNRHEAELMYEFVRPIRNRTKGIVFRTMPNRQPFNPLHDCNLTCIGKAVAFNEKDEATFTHRIELKFEKGG